MGFIHCLGDFWWGVIFIVFGKYLGGLQDQIFINFARGYCRFALGKQVWQYAGVFYGQCLYAVSNLKLYPEGVVGALQAAINTMPPARK